MAHPFSDSDSLLLEISYKENGNGDYVRDQYSWYHLRDGEEEPTMMLDIKLIDLETRLKLPSLPFQSSH